MSFAEYIANQQRRLAEFIATILPSDTTEPLRLHSAMRYAVLNGGKRIRPILVYATGEAFNVSADQLDIPAAAIELVHCYSLIHDDLPAMDNDDWRRGKPTTHKAFDEATAILAGDTLFNFAYELISNANIYSTTKRIKLIQTLAHACSSHGISGGQALDLAATKNLTLQQLELIHTLKTGALITASVKLGAIIANAKPKQLSHLETFANALGLAFQIQDDIFDAKSKSDEPNYANLLGVNGAHKRLDELKTQTFTALNKLTSKKSESNNIKLLKQLADYILNRKF